LAHQVRDEKRTKELKKLAAEITKADGKARLSKSAWKRMRNSLRRTYRISAFQKQSLVSFLESLGLNVVVADGEADVWIARQTDSFSVLSSDSDTLFHTNVQTWFIPKIRGNVMLCSVVAKEDVLARLELLTYAFTTLGIYSYPS